MKHAKFPYLLAIFPLMLLFVGCVPHGVESGADELEAVSDSLAEATRLSDTVRSSASDRSHLSFGSSGEALEYMRRSPERDRYMAGILPQMAKDQLDYCVRLLNNTHDGFIVVDKDRMKVILFDRYGVERHSYGMACAKNYGSKHKKADSRTPEGFFEVEGIYDSTDWLFTDDNGVQSPKKGQFGPRFIRLKTPISSQIGIHGTCAPWSIGGRSSHGCIRITNENILELVKLVEKGMPVIVSPGRKDMAVNMREGYDIPSISTLPGRARACAKEPAPEELSVKAESDSVISYPEVTHPESSPETTAPGSSSPDYSPEESTETPSDPVPVLSDSAPLAGISR